MKGVEIVKKKAEEQEKAGVEGVGGRNICGEGGGEGGIG